MKLAATFTALCLMALSQPLVAETRDSVVAERQDTLKMVVVKGHARPPVMDAIDKTLKTHQQPRVKTLGEILNERFPNVMDCILHPFAIKERRRERRQKRLKRVLQQYEMTKTPNELLREAIRREEGRDSIGQ